LAGWRARLGVLVPSINKTMEPELYKMAPEGVSIHFAKMREKEDTVEELRKMAEDVPRAATELADAKVDLIAFGCTTGSLIEGLGYDQELIRKIEELTDIPATTTSTAVVSALKELGVKTICVATPYMEELNAKAKVFLESHNFNVINIKGLGCRGPETADVPARQVYALAKEVFRSNADALFISCTDFRTLDVLDALEHDLKKPVVSSNQATMWMMLRKVGIGESIKGYGTLLAKMTDKNS